jgi:hypothetical protein
MRTWNKRAVQGALIRLDQSGMIRRFRIRKQKAEESWINCIQIQREPRAEDLDNLGFRRQAAIVDTTDELPQDDVDGDTLMRDLEVDMLEDGADENDANNTNNNNSDEVVRIPPQWTPDRLLSNIIYEFTALGQASGWDALALRDRVVGPFWRRPTESYLTRLTDDWERMQPHHLRHLAIIRDTRTSDEKRFVHYVYRTYHHFQEAVDAGDADWEGVKRPSTKSTGKSASKKHGKDDATLDPWGLRGLNQKNFVRFNGTATLAEVRAAIVGLRGYGPRWDIDLAKDIGYEKLNTPVPKIKGQRRSKKSSADLGGSHEHPSTEAVPQPDSIDDDGSSDDQAVTPSVLQRSKTGKAKKQGSGLTLTPDQRIALGLKPSGRLSKSAANQILAHRRETGDPTSLPDTIVGEPVVRGYAPLLTKEERIALNLPPKGRLGLEKENEIREQRGMPKLVEKGKKKRGAKEPTVLTKQQRIMLGFKDHGRLHQHFMDALRREQENNVPLETSPAVKEYREFLRAEEAKSAARKNKCSISGRSTPTKEQTPQPPNETGPGTSEAQQLEVSETMSSITATPGKRKADDLDKAPSASKRQRTSLGSSQDVVNQSTLERSEDFTTLSDDNSHNTSVLPNEGSLHPPQDVPTASCAASREKSPGTFSKPVPKRKVDDSNHGDIVRSSPGLYVYLSAKRKIGRGRPRNACIAIVRMPQLSELPWFTKESNSGSDPSQVVSMGPCKPPLLQSSVTNNTEPGSGPSADADIPRDSSGPAELEAPSQPRATADIEVEVPADPAAQGCGENERHKQAEVQEFDPAIADKDILMDVESSMQLQAPPSQPPMNTSEIQREHPIVTAETQLRVLDGTMSTGEQSMARGTVGLVPSNASTQVTKPSYQSPYAQSASTVPAQHSDSINAPKLPTMRLETADPSTEASTALPQGVVGEVAEREDAEIAAHKKQLAKVKAPTVVGTALKFRREIIQEIIDRCGGVFPLHGEIGRPFKALWNLRHGHTSIREPESSTVQDTLKNMISNPAFNLKRMAFYVKARNATGRRERAIVARSDIAPTDPKVMRLAYNMANHATDKSNQFFPDEIRDVFQFETMYIPPPVPPKDESFTLAQIYPELEESIKKNKERRLQEKAAQKKAEKAAAKKQNEQVEKIMPKKCARAQVQVQNVEAQNIPRAKRTRLASLNDKNKRYRRAPVQTAIMEDLEEEWRETEVREPSPAGTDSLDDVPLVLLRPRQASITETDAYNGSPSLSAAEDRHDDIVDDLGGQHALVLGMNSFTHPVICFHPTTGTFNTQFDLVASFEGLPSQPVDSEALKTAPQEIVVSPLVMFTHPLIDFHLTTGTFSTLFGLHISPGAPSVNSVAGIVRKRKRATEIKKRVRIHDPATEHTRKRARTNPNFRQEVLDDEFVYSSVEDSDATSSEDEEEESRSKQKQKRRKRVSKRQTSKNLGTPTLLERLTGLTGNPDDPIYKDPKQRQRSSRPARPWAERKKKQLNKLRKEREYADTMDHADPFKKLSLTLALAFLMSGDDGAPSWSIVEKVYARETSFDLQKVKKLWSWMQSNMTLQLANLVETLQANLLAAYDAGRLPTIDDPETYDWAGLVRWTMRTCAYPELPLPLYREAIEKFVVDESGYAAVDRVSWYGKRLADTVRAQLQLQLPFVAPLSRSFARRLSSKDKEVKARSWIRANTATPQSVYDAHLAHEKLKLIGEDVLSRIVGDFVQQEHLKMRKLKRQLPGRNYTFTKKFAKAYKRQIELEDFMVAATVKKELDTAFADEDPSKRLYSISRCEEDGSIMAIMSLVADGKVKILPCLPPVNNEFGAPLPRLSKWGFCEGDYIHRAIDRNRLFWDTHVVPTSDYQFGNPLQPSSSPAADWPSLPEPPLPGKYDKEALLPIWSSIDGQTVTWPWWYRILNLVLQPLFLQPSATAIDIHAHCQKHATEIFEVELVLGWLESVNAISKTIGEGYQVTPNFWAAFGDRLYDVENDWFGEHVKRNVKMTTKQQWRDKYNLQYSKMRTQSTPRANAGETQQPSVQSNDADVAVDQQIISNSKAQYSILQQALLEPVRESSARSQWQIQPWEVQQSQLEATTNMQSSSNQAPGLVAMDEAQTVVSQHTHNEATVSSVNVDMEDAGAGAESEDADAEGDMDDVDAEGEVDDVDAEGEVDDACY